MNAKLRGRKTIQLEKYIKEKLGIDAIVWYEPINGPCMEMQGYAGGWYYRDKEDLDESEYDDPSWGEPIGYNIKEAMNFIDITSKVYYDD